MLELAGIDAEREVRLVVFDAGQAEVGDGARLEVGDVGAECDVRTLTVPKLLSFMATGSIDGTVEGVKDVNARYQEQFGPGDYRPNLMITYWSFRLMVGFGAVASVGVPASDFLAGADFASSVCLRLLSGSDGL